MKDDLLDRILERQRRKRTLRCRRCPWHTYGDAAAVVVAYEEHLNDVHMGLGDIGHLEVDVDQARSVAALHAFEGGSPRAMKIGSAAR